MQTFKRLGFELSYLALLTKENVKPLSRWEDGISHAKIKALQKLGLTTRIVKRKLLNGGVTHELIFGQSSRYLDFYSDRFDSSFIKRDYATIITEGLLFGYPGCCTRSFAENGYTGNHHKENGQEILFHWVCPGCEITPSLLPYYQKIYDECKSIFANRKMERYGYLKKFLPAAAFALSFFLIPTRIRAENPHWLPLIGNDLNHDYLTYSEEVLLGTHSNYFPADSFAGPAKALEFKAIIDSLPIVDNVLVDPPEASCYVIEHLQRGIVACPVCGASINMGYIDVFNPMRDLSMSLPYLGLHFLENGSFSYGDTANYTRIDIELFKKILAHYDSTHFEITTSSDADDDGLQDDYEDDFSTQLNNPDSNENQLVDGAEIAEELINTIAELPVVEGSDEPPVDSVYIEYHPARGSETCDICGIAINMGEVRIVNPTAETEISFPIIGLHYLAHGRFAYGGSTNSGEIDALQLAQVLENQSIVSLLKNLPDRHNISLKNYPNPFNPETTIRCNLPKSSHITLTIYNTLGQKIITLFDGKKAAGSYSVKWNGQDVHGKDVASGIYFCKLISNDVFRIQKMVLTR